MKSWDIFSVTPKLFQALLFKRLDLCWWLRNKSAHITQASHTPTCTHITAPPKHPVSKRTKPVSVCNRRDEAEWKREKRWWPDSVLMATAWKQFGGVNTNSYRHSHLPWWTYAAPSHLPRNWAPPPLHPPFPACVAVTHGRPPHILLMRTCLCA